MNILKSPIPILLSALFLIAGTFSALAQEKKASPPASAKGTVDGVDITIDYHSPGVKDREIFGGLVKWDNVWRAGANNATTISFSEDVKINGENLPKGKYGFFIIPKEDGSWTIIFNEVWKQWGAYDYDSGKDVLRVDVAPEEVDLTERLTYSIEEDGTVSMVWAETRLPFTVSRS